MSDSLRPLELQHSRLPCPSPSPGPCSNSCPLSQWCQPAILFSVVLSFSCLHSFPGPFLRDFSNESALHIMWPKYCSFSFSISPSNEYSGLISFRIWLIGSPCRPRDSQKSSPKKKVFSSTTIQKHQFFSTQPCLWYNSHIHNAYWKNHSFDYTDLCQQSNVSAF